MFYLYHIAYCRLCTIFGIYDACMCLTQSVILHTCDTLVLVLLLVLLVGVRVDVGFVVVVGDVVGIGVVGCVGIAMLVVVLLHPMYTQCW